MFSNILKSVSVTERGASNQLNGTRIKGSLTSASGQIPTTAKSYPYISRSQPSPPSSLKESESKPLKSVPIASKRTSPTTVAEFPMINSNDKSDTVEEAQTQNLDFTATGEKATEKKYTRIKNIVEQYYLLTTEEDKDIKATNRGGSDLLKVNSRGSDAGDLESTSTTQEESQAPSVGSWATDRLSITRTSIKVLSPPEFEGSWTKRRMQISNTSIKPCPDEQKSLTQAIVDSDANGNSEEQKPKLTKYSNMKITETSIQF